MCVAMLVGATVLALLAGCVAAESNRYRGTVSRSFAPDTSANAEVAGAFGMMRDDDDPAVNMAAASDSSDP
jgi:hypothetical protein